MHIILHLFEKETIFSNYKSSSRNENILKKVKKDIILKKNLFKRNLFSKSNFRDFGFITHSNVLQRKQLTPTT